MTDPEFADATYVEPITPEVVEAIIAKERPDALLPTLGGQTALNTAIALHEAGVLEKYGVELIGANIEAIQLGRGPPAVQGASSTGAAASPPAAPSRTRSTRPSASPTTSATRSSCGRRSPWAASAPASPTTRTELRRIAGPGPAPLADHRGAPRGVDPRLEGVRARADARPRRQRGRRLLHRERRPDGRAHRRLHHRRAGPDADRPRVPADARHRHRDHPRGRRRHRRLQHPVRGQPRRPAASSSSR